MKKFTLNRNPCTVASMPGEVPFNHIWSNAAADRDKLCLTCFQPKMVNPN